MEQRKKAARQPAAVASAQLSSIDIDRLVLAAQDCRGRAYAPYSNYHVGAAVLTGEGRVFGGCNIENASYSATLCAERAAIASAIAAGQRNLKAIAIATETLASPCGVCRQFLVEFNPGMTVILADAAGRRETHIASDLLPRFFGPAHLDVPSGTRKKA